MKRKLLLSAAVAAVLSAHADVTASWPMTHYNFGAFSEESGPVSCEFPIVNTGTEPLAIVSARATCGCTQPTYPQQAIAPGDTAYIRVTYDPQGRPGRFSKQVYVNTNASVPKMKLDISGVVIGAPATIARRYPADFGPLKLEHNAMMMGEILKTETKTVYFNGYNRSADSLGIVVTRQPAWLELQPTPKEAPAGELVTLVGFINASKCPDYGLVEDSVTLRMRTGQEYTIPLTLLVNEDFSKLSPSDVADAPVAKLSADKVDFGSDPLGLRTLTLTNAGKSPLMVRRIYSADRGVLVTIESKTVKPGKSAQIQINTTQQALSNGVLNARISLITNDPMNPIQTIRLVGVR